MDITQLNAATQLQLTRAPATAGARALIDDLTERVAATEATRIRPRRQVGQSKQRRAVGAIIGGLLERWGRPEPQVVFRSRQRASFSAGPVGYRQYVSVLDALISLGLVAIAAGISFGGAVDNSKPFTGLAERLWPLQPLLDLAAVHGVTPRTIETDFTHVYPRKPPSVPSPVELFALRTKRAGHRIRLRIASDDREASLLQAQVEDFNNYVAKHDVRGCSPPRFMRVFTASWDFGGHWYAVGTEGVYQRMSEVERLALTIDGERVIETDVAASQLSIMHGLLGLEPPNCDPYAINGIPRSVVKHWVLATLGKGARVSRWAAGATEREPELADYDARMIGKSICEQYPFLHDPTHAVAEVTGLDKFADSREQRKLLTHRLMAIEANVITAAMGLMRGSGALALPIHDSLIVPASMRGAVGEALAEAYRTLAKARIKCKVTESAPA